MINKNKFSNGPVALNFREILKLGRIEFAGFLFCVMLSGAIGLHGRTIMLTDVFTLFIIAFLSNLWGFIHNDYCDVDIDKRSPELNSRPLVRGTVSLSMARRMIACCILLTIVITLLLNKGTISLLVLVASMVLGWWYNRLSKKLPGADLLFAASTALLCLLGALWISGNPASSTLNWNLAGVVVATQFIDHIVFNAGATLKDVKNDRASMAVTMATFSGVTLKENDELLIPVRFKMYIILLKLTAISIVLVSPFLTGIPFSLLQGGTIIMVAIASLYLTIDAITITVFNRHEIGRRWVKQEAAGKLLLPLLLIHTAGLGWSLFLIFFAFLWFLFCNVIVYKKGFSLNRGY